MTRAQFKNIEFGRYVTENGLIGVVGFFVKHFIVEDNAQCNIMICIDWEDGERKEYFVSRDETYSDIEVTEYCHRK